MRDLYPEIQPFRQFFLETGGAHRVYVEQSGDPQGLPVIFLHGGPCSGVKPDHRRFFNPERYHIILLDQRGCGQSTPFGELLDNDTPHLLADLEQIRTELGIGQWVLFGGSWGATLALLYAQQYPENVSAMILRGSFLARAEDMDWYLGGGLRRIYPQAWSELLQALPEAARVNPARALIDAVFSEDEPTALAAAKQWQNWGGLTALGPLFQANPEPASARDLLQARMELHYARHHYFIAENQILTQSARLPRAPTYIIHGQQDLVCPPDCAWLLRQALPHAAFILLPNAGHVARGAEMTDALVSACDRIAEVLTGHG